MGKTICVPVEELEHALKALRANHQHHQDYDDYEGYPDSELAETNTTAIISLRNLLAASSEKEGIK